MGRRSNARERILDAASQLLWENGCCCVTVDDICARAGVQKGSFYHFFESKSEVVAAALQHGWETILEPAYEKHFARKNPPLKRIKDFLHWVQQLQMEKYRTFGRVVGWPVSLLSCVPLDGEQPVREKLCAIESAERHYFESAIRDAIKANAIEPCDPVAEAMSLRARMEWVLARARLLNKLDEVKALSALKLDLKMNRKRVPPRTFFFVGKAAPAYHFAKLVIKFINNLANTLDGDPISRGRLKVVFVPDCVAEHLIPVSGTSNKKFMMNGALTIGTRAVAAVEMAATAGEENFSLFGLTTEQVEGCRGSYNPHRHYDHEPDRSGLAAATKSAAD